MGRKPRDMYTAEVLKLPDGSLAPGEKKRLRKRYIAQKRAERALNKDEINIEELAVALWEMYHEEGTEVTHCERSGETMSVPSAKGDEQTVEEETGPFAVRSSAEKEREEVITIAEATVSASEPLMEIGPVAKNNESTVHKLIKFAGFRYGDSKSGNNVYVQVFEDSKREARRKDIEDVVRKWKLAVGHADARSFQLPDL